MPVLTPLQDAQNAPAIRVWNLSKKYGDFFALKRVSFEAHRGIIFGLLGPNGAGKSTCIKILATLLHPTGGQAFVGGLDVAKSPLDVKRLLGYLPEMPALFEHVTGREFLALMGGLRGMETRALTERICHFEDALDMGEKMDVLIGTYSKGMRQKIAFANAVLHRPRILILDEPTSGLDPRFSRYVKDMVLRLAGEGRTVLMSTHITDVAEELCDRLAIINRGEIAAMGTVPEVLTSTRSGCLEEAFINVVEG